MHRDLLWRPQLLLHRVRKSYTGLRELISGWTDAREGACGTCAASELCRVTDRLGPA